MLGLAQVTTFWFDALVPSIQTDWLCPELLIYHRYYTARVYYDLRALSLSHGRITLLLDWRPPSLLS